MMMYYLQAKGADINATDNDGHTPLMWASDQARLDAVIFLVKQSVNVQQQDSAGVCHTFERCACVLIMF
jgi:ankyrin repeat protein